MMRTIPVVYEGTEPYIFAGYCHEDAQTVLPILRDLERMGYRVWYDCGTCAGAVWPEVIANHLGACSCFLAFVSGAFQASHNCRSAFNSAMMENKPFVSVIMDRSPLSPVMKMQLSKVQTIDLLTCSSQAAFMDALTHAEAMAPCLRRSAGAGGGQEERTLMIEPGTARREDAGKRAYQLLRSATGEMIPLGEGEFKIGRKEDKCDYAVPENHGISRVHAIFQMRDGRLYVMDNDSLNGTYVNDIKVRPDQILQLRKGDVIDLSGELFVVKTT